MSADEWVECPICNKEGKEKIAKLEAILSEAYSKKTAKEYDVLKEDITKKINKIKEEYSGEICRQDGVYEHSFDMENKLELGVTFYCTRCKTEWNTTGVKFSPTKVK